MLNLQTWKAICVMTDEELLVRAMSFEFLSYDPHDSTVPQGRIRSLRIERRTRESDPNVSWAITDGSQNCLGRDSLWYYESQPSSRADEFLMNCRWSNLREAVAFMEAHMQKYPLGYSESDR